MFNRQKPPEIDEGGAERTSGRSESGEPQRERERVVGMATRKGLMPREGGARGTYRLSAVQLREREYVRRAEKRKVAGSEEGREEHGGAEGREHSRAYNAWEVMWSIVG